MKGTLSLTRIRPQIYNTRAPGRPVFPHRRLRGSYGSFQFPRFAAKLHALFSRMPPFGNGFRLWKSETGAHKRFSPYVDARICLC